MSEENKNNVWSSFWLDKAAQDELQAELAEEQSEKKETRYEGGLDMATMRLSSGRRAISNFVNILTGRDIPVLFSSDSTSMTDGKTVYISSNISKLEDFDPTVGLALHEGSHIVLTDFALIKTLWGRISDLYKLGKEIGISKKRVAEFTKLMVNYVEDRYIDNYIFQTAPGYRPYYISLYDKYFNNAHISKALKSDLMRQPTLAAYEARILNLTNPCTDLSALPGLKEIAKTISLRNIKRLKTTADRIKVATEITKIVFSNIKDYVEEPTSPGNEGQGDGGQGTDDDSDENHSVTFDIRVESEDDVIGGYNVGDEPEEDNNDKDKDSKKSDQDDLGNDGKTSKASLKKVKKAIEEQKKFVENHGNADKKPVSAKQKLILDIIEKSGITFIPIKVADDNSQVFEVNCIVVKNMTSALMFSGMFPLCKYAELSDKTEAPNNVKEAVNRGIQLGTRLGKKLQIRQEVNVTTFPRRRQGKIFRRLLADIGVDSDSIFYTVKYDQYDKLNIHISVDASSSMSHGEKWDNTMTMIVALCKAGSMIENMRVTVSFRATIMQIEEGIGHRNLPYIVLAYDSSKDKFSKIKRLFPYLLPYGETPEGLAFDAIMDKLVCKKPGEIYYFLNVSDGEPCFNYRDNEGKHFSYGLKNGATHTKKQYRKIIQSGVKGISYFIKSSYGGTENEKCFKQMYGKDAKFINVNDVVPIARTMNELFLDKG